MRLLPVLILALLVVFWWLHMAKSKRRTPPTRDKRSHSASRHGNPEAMLQCAHCGVYLPASEAVAGPDGQLAFCSDEHRLLHRG